MKSVREAEVGSATAPRMPTMPGTPRPMLFVLWGLLAIVAALIVCAVAFRWDQAGTLHDPRWQIILTVVGLIVGVWLTGIQARASRAGRFRRTAAVSVAAILFSQVCYLFLVWTRWKMDTLVWRFWWISMVAACTATHIVWLRLSGAPDRRTLTRMTVAGALFVAAMLASLGLRENILAGAGPVFPWLVGIPAAFVTLISTVLWLRGVRLSRRHGIPRPVKVGWLIAGQAMLVAAAFYAGRVTAPGPDLFGPGPSPLAQVPLDELKEQLATDLTRLKIVAKGLEELEAKATSLASQFSQRRAAEDRSRLTPEEDDLLRSQFMSHLAYRDALLRMVAAYSGFESVRDPRTRARCVLVAHAAGSLVFEYSLKLVWWYQDEPMVRQKLNEPDARWGIPAGMFDRIYENVSNPRNCETLAEISAYVEAHRQEWSDAHVFAAEDLGWLTARVAQSADQIKARPIHPIEAIWQQAVLRVKQDAYTPVYATQSVVSTWIGDTRLVQWEPLITIEQIHQMQPKLQPGDILLERRNWFLSNAFLPGFWPHAALYIGTKGDLEKLGLLKRNEDGQLAASDPNLALHLADYLKPAADGEAHTVIEAVSEGVILNSLTESMHADYVAVLRPRLMPQQKAQAIARAFEHIGKPYDFDFDFATSDKLVCSEIVYRAYAGMIRFDPYMQKIMGREALPPLEIARKFAAERASPADRQLDFVLFLDGIASQRGARLADEEAFCSSITRARGYSE